MAEPSARRKQGDQPALLDAELAHLPPELRWREWMGRVEAVIFAASTPVSHERLARVVGNSCNLDLIIDDIRAELAGRPYELVAVAGGWQHRTRKVCALFHRCAFGTATGQGADSDAGSKPLSQSEALVLTAIAYFQPITRGELSRFFGKEVSWDLIGALRSQDLIASGPRSPQPGAPTPTSPPRPFWRSSASTGCATCPRGARGRRSAVEGQVAGRRHYLVGYGPSASTIGANRAGGAAARELAA